MALNLTTTLDLNDFLCWYINRKWKEDVIPLHCTWMQNCWLLYSCQRLIDKFIIPDTYTTQMVDINIKVLLWPNRVHNSTELTNAPKKMPEFFVNFYNFACKQGRDCCSGWYASPGFSWSFDLNLNIKNWLEVCQTRRYQTVFCFKLKSSPSGQQIFPQLLRCRTFAVAYYSFMPGALTFEKLCWWEIRVSQWIFFLGTLMTVKAPVKIHSWCVAMIIGKIRPPILCVRNKYSRKQMHFYPELFIMVSP